MSHPFHHTSTSRRRTILAITALLVIALIATVVWSSRRGDDPVSSATTTVDQGAATPSTSPVKTDPVASPQSTQATLSPTNSSVPLSGKPIPHPGDRLPDLTQKGTVNDPSPRGTALGESVVVMAVGDIACTPDSQNFNEGKGKDGLCQHDAVAQAVIRQNPAFFLVLGDVQYERGTLTDFRASYDKSFGRLKSLTKPVPGNHEYYTNAKGYFDYFGTLAGKRGEGYYAFDIGSSWRAYALNTNCEKVGCGSGSPQYRWLSADLAAHRDKNVLAFAHHPRFSSGGTHGNNSSVDALWQLLANNGADLYLAGHDHVYERFTTMDAKGSPTITGGMRSFVVGSGGKNHHALGTVRPGSEARDAKSYGALKLVLNPTSYDWSFVTTPGSTFFDSGTQPVR